jgi:DNA-binding SARP family transcriptional activator
LFDNNDQQIRPPQWRVLGPFEVVVGGGAIVLGRPQHRIVLARLVAAAGTVVSVETLAAELWGHHRPDDAYRTVRTYVSRLRATIRRATGRDDMLATRAPGYQLVLDPETVDAVRFERLATRGRRSLRGNQPRLAYQELTAALALWRGEAYGTTGTGPALTGERARLDGLRLSAVEAQVDAALATGLDTELVVELEGLVHSHPTRERLWGQLMTALYRSGRQADALAAFRTVRAMLINDHGVEPSPPLTEIHRRILRQDLPPVPVAA